MLTCLSYLNHNAYLPNINRILGHWYLLTITISNQKENTCICREKGVCKVFQETLICLTESRNNAYFDIYI